jgi:cell division protein FtsW (lipid II flippase)
MVRKSVSPAETARATRARYAVALVMTVLVGAGIAIMVASAAQNPLGSALCIAAIGIGMLYLGLRRIPSRSNVDRSKAGR